MDPIPQSKRTAERRGSRRSAEPDALQNIAAAVAETSDPFAALVAVAEQVAPLFRARLATVLILGEGVGGHHFVMSDPDLRENAESLFVEQNRDVDGWLEALRRRDFNAVNLQVPPTALPKEWSAWVRAEELGRLLVVPLAVRGSTVGALAVIRTRSARAFTERDQQLARRIANMVALTIGVAVQTQELDRFFASSLDLHCMIDAAGRLHRPNPRWEPVLGHDPGELEGAMFLDLVHADDRPSTCAAFDDLRRAKVPAQFVTRLRSSDGSYRSIEWLARPGTGLIYASGRDITVREGLRRALQESEDAYRLIAQNTSDVILLLDTETMTLEYVSPSIERLTGFAPEELVGCDLAVLLPPVVRERAAAMTEAQSKALLAGDPEAGYYYVDSEFLRKGGGTVPVELSIKVLIDSDGRARKHVSLCRDIAARKTAEKDLRASQKRLEDLMLVVSDWIWEADPEYRYTRCSEGVRSVLGYEPAEVIGKRPWDFMPPGEAEEMRLYAVQRAETKSGCIEVVNRNLHRDGREVVLLTSCVPILDDSGELVGFRGIDKDITIATQTQESLRRSVIELNSLWQIAETVAAPGGLTAALGAVTRQIADALAARFALMVTFGEGGEGRHVIASNAADTAWCEDVFLEHAEGELPDLAVIAGVGDPVVINDVDSVSLPARMAAEAASNGVSRLLILPLVLTGEIIGTLVATRGPDAPPFRGREVEFAQAAAGSIAAAVVHTRLRLEENLKTATEVRDHLARELHDAVTQSVYSASLIAQALPTIWQRSPEEGLAGLGQLQRLVRSALAELRILLYELRPGTLAGVGLDQLLERLGDSLAGQADVSVDIDARVETPPPEKVKQAMYRIAQEAFNNIAKHAKATRVLATVVADGEGAVLNVQDDGVGLDPDAVEGDHMGLAIMRERAREIGAQWEIARMEPSGTRITVRWTAPEAIPAIGSEEKGV